MTAKSFIVCGWYTPDYACWWDKLRPTLKAVGAPHDFVEVTKAAGGWERNTMRKPAQIAAAFDRHPEKTVIFIDVDCTVLSPLDELAGISGDIGVYIRTRFRSNGEPKLGPRSGTMVFQPTIGARRFVEAWIAEGRNAAKYGVDQDSLAVALGRVPGLSVTTLGVEWCAVPADNCDSPKILHDSASRDSKTGRLARAVSFLSGRRLVA
ncbi:MAG: hypothetical protein C0519_14040 [Hyphomicrobium sp.]|nr:hypothetical protein [Hyphomicrobium sp.]PPD06274.1 MAG: hypothetical protein CTY28_14405 [Hyphomicrobium sp.]